MSRGAWAPTAGKLRRTRGAVSPVVAEVLMVSITIVLVGALTYYLMGLQQTGETYEPALGTRLTRGSGQWILEIVSGKSAAAGTRIQLVNSSTGASTFSSSILDSSPYFRFNDNNGNLYIDGGDTILLNETAGYVEEGFKLLLISEKSVLAGPIVLRA